MNHNEKGRVGTLGIGGKLNTKYNDLGMRDRFEFQVFISRNGSEEKIPGKFVYHDNVATLSVANPLYKIEIEDKLEKQSWYYAYRNPDNTINSLEDFQVEVTTWEHKALNIFSSKRRGCSSNSNGAIISNFFINEFSISEEMSNENVKEFQLKIDYLFKWFGLNAIKHDMDDVFRVKYQNLKFDMQNFDLEFIETIRNSTNLQEEKYYHDMYVKFTFKEAVSREDAFKTTIFLRRLFQILMNCPTTISQAGIIRNDYIENYFIRQFQLSNEKENVFFDPYFSITHYETLKEKMYSILENWFKNKKLQDFVFAYLISTESNIPIYTEWINLSAAIESYCRDAEYSNEKQIKDFGQKIIFLGKKLLQNNIKAGLIATQEFSDVIKDTRDYYIHGDKADKYEQRFEDESKLIGYIEQLRELSYHSILLKLGVYDERT